MRWLLASLLLLLPSLSSAAPPALAPIAPKALDEVGLMTGQPNVVFGEGSRLIYFKEKSYRERQPPDWEYSGGDLAKRALLNNAYLSFPQLAWNNVLMKIQVEPTSQRIAYSRVQDRRASLAGILTEDDAANVMALIQSGKGFNDNKGTGISFLAELSQALYLQMMSILSGTEANTPQLFDLVSPKQISLRKEWVQKAKEGLSWVEAELAKETDPSRSVVLRYFIKNKYNEVDPYDLFLQGLAEKEATGFTDPATVIKFGKRLAQCDGINGLFEAARGLREAVIAELLEEIYAILNPIWGTTLGVVPIDYVIALPVMMKSISYHFEMAAGVLGRAPNFRAKSTYTPDGKRRFWFPEALVFSRLPGGEQFDVNGRHIDLELIDLNIPGIQEYFVPHFLYGQELDRRCVEASKAAIAGDTAAVPLLIAEIKNKINRPELIAWAKKNRPPVGGTSNDPFTKARLILQPLEMSDSIAETHQERPLKEQLKKLRKAGHADQITALWPSLFRHAYPVGQSFLKESIHIIGQEQKRELALALKARQPRLEVSGQSDQAQTASEARMLEIKDFSFLGDLLSSMFFESSFQDQKQNIKFEFAETIVNAAPLLFAKVYGGMGVEQYKRGLSEEARHPLYFIPGQNLYEAATTFAGQLALVLARPHIRPTEFPLAELIDAPIKVGSLSMDRAQVVSYLFRDSVESMGAFIKAIEHVTGMKTPPEILGSFFPGHAEELKVYLYITDLTAKMSQRSRMSCILEMLEATGRLDGLANREGIAGILRFFSDDTTPPPQKRLGEK